VSELEDFGIIKRTIIPNRPVQTEYSLTDKGMALETLLADIATFSTRFKSKRVFKDGRPRMTFKQIFRTERLSEIYDY
jgi:DNA-binding HxlR family transcriptional regulator